MKTSSNGVSTPLNPLLTYFALVTTWLICTPAVADCPPLRSARDVIECALLNHPNLIRQKSRAAQSQELQNQAKQRPNPELGTRAVFGKASGELESTIEVNLAHTLELGGKHSARIERALAETEERWATLQSTQEEVFLTTLKSLYRLRQLKIEKKTFDDALSTFSKLENQFKSRAKLGPEQEVSFGIITLAANDHALRRVTLENEEDSLIRELSLSLGQPFVVSESTLPPQTSRWPAIEEQPTDTIQLSSLLKLAKADLKIAQADSSAAQSLSWPDLKLGPSIESQTQGALNYRTYGANLSFAIPVFQANGAGRAYAAMGLDAAQNNFTLRQKQVESARKAWIEKYNRAVKALSQSISPLEIEKKHRSMEGFFIRGLLPSSLVIEAHRQIFDLTRSQHEFELSAVEALWQIRALDGTLMTEAL